MLRLEGSWYAMTKSERDDRRIGREMVEGELADTIAERGILQAAVNKKDERIRMVTFERDAADAELDESIAERDIARAACVELQTERDEARDLAAKFCLERNAARNELALSVENGKRNEGDLVEVRAELAAMRISCAAFSAKIANQRRALRDLHALLKPRA